MAKQITQAEALRDIGAIRDRLLTLKEHMEPLSYGLAQQLNICLHSLRTFEDQVRRHYRHDEELP
jgi:hypothetical protein